MPFFRRSNNMAIIKKAKKTYSIDDCIYDSKPLADYHKYLTRLMKSGEIESFQLPQAGNVAKSKFHAYKAIINGIQFDSLNESRFYIKLLQEKHAGRLDRFELQVPFEIVPSHIKNGKRIRKMEYLADFVLYKNNQRYVIDVKGVETEVFKIKKKLVEFKYQDVTIMCIKYVPALDKWLTTKEYRKYIKIKKSKKTA